MKTTAAHAVAVTVADENKIRRDPVVVADSGFAVIELLRQLRQLKNPVCMITRLRLDAALCTSQPNPLPESEDAHARRARACRPWKKSLKTNLLGGSD
jgi:hypothetical protein